MTLRQAKYRQVTGIATDDDYWAPDWPTPNEQHETPPGPVDSRAERLTTVTSRGDYDG